MYEIILDTETTGFDPKDGHRLVEIGCVEVHNFVATGRTYHQYLNPERDIPAEAVAVHGLTTDFLKDKPVFGETVDAFLEFIADKPLVIHNAEFDLRFINAELVRLGYKPIKNNVTDTVLVARRMFPGQPANLDALCRRFKIDNTNRTLHGALLDAQLLADVYLELNGGRQSGFLLGGETGKISDPQDNHSESQTNHESLSVRPARTFAIPGPETEAHAKMIAALGDAAIWKKYS